MNALPKQRKLQPTEYFWLALLFLFAVSVFNLGGYILVVLLALFLMLHIRGIEVSPTMLSLLFFSVFYFLFYLAHFDPSITEVFNYLIAPWAAFAFGDVYTRKFGGSRAAGCVTLMVTMGLFSHGLLNLLAYLGGAAEMAGRVAFDFWRQEVISVTANGLYFSMALGLAMGMVFTRRPGVAKLLAVIVITAACVNATLLGHRTSLYIFVLLFVYNVAAVFLGRGSSLRQKNRIAAAGVALILIVVVIWVTDLAGLRTWVQGTSLYRRMTDADSVHSTSRLLVWKSFFAQAIFHPFGGAAFRLTEDHSWVHNLWLDVYYKVGVLAFVCLLIATVLIGAQFVRFCRHCRKTGREEDRRIVTNLYLAVLLSCMVEPIIDANPYVLIAFFMITGCVGALLRRQEEIPA